MGNWERERLSMVEDGVLVCLYVKLVRKRKSVCVTVRERERGMELVCLKQR